MNKFLCLDTNVFEHFPPIDQVDWTGIVDCSHATLVIPQVTIRELNRHKDTSPRGKLKRRAASALSQLTRLSRLPRPAAVRTNVDIVFLKTEPTLDFAAYHLLRDMPDDYLIASAIELAHQEGCPAEQMVVMTSDLGLELKVSGQRGVVACPMPDALRLPDEPDAEEREIASLREQLKKLNSQLPDVKIRLHKGLGDDDADIATVNWRDVELTEDELAVALEEEKKENPYLCPYPTHPPGYRFRNADARLLQQFNDYLNGYFRRYSEYLKKFEEVENWRARTRALVLVVSNEGGTPATSIEITLRFPKGISVIFDRDYKQHPEMPLPPTFDGRGRPQADAVEPEIELESEPRTINVASIRNFPDGSEVLLTAKSLKHTAEDSRALNLHFRTQADVHPFQLEYEIWMSNFPTRLRGMLNVTVKAGT